jgi:hypothetical protein
LLLGHVVVTLEITGILVKWQTDDLAENVENVVLVVKALLELDVLIPEGMRQEVLTAAFCATLEKPKIVR